MTGASNGYLLIADITGYTAYLTATELEHAQGTLTALLEVLLDQTRPPLVLSRLAGDAVVSYALGDAFVSGQTFVEMIENTYVAFKDSIDLMRKNNTCTCNACARVGDLDLKFFVHYGTFLRQKVTAHEELLGQDVNLLFRLTKNRVTESTGLTAYALYTQAAIDHLGVEGLTDTMRAHRESTDVGEVQAWIADMSGVWGNRKASEPQELGPILTAASIVVDVPPTVLWGYIANPEHLRVLLAARRVGLSSLASGRVAKGSVVHCFHGDNATTLAIVDWSPPERMLVKFTIPVPVLGVASGSCEYTLEPTGTGTRLTENMARPTGPVLARTTAGFMFSNMKKQTRKQLGDFKAHVEADHAGRTPMPVTAVFTPEQLRAAARSSLVPADASP